MVNRAVITGNRTPDFIRFPFTGYCLLKVRKRPHRFRDGQRSCRSNIEILHPHRSRLQCNEPVAPCAAQPLKYRHASCRPFSMSRGIAFALSATRSEEHTSELQSLRHLVCRLLLEKKTKHIGQKATAALHAAADGVAGVVDFQ